MPTYFVFLFVLKNENKFKSIDKKKFLFKYDDMNNKSN